MHARIRFSDQAMGDKIYIKVFAPVIMEHISTLYKKLFTYKPVLDADDLVLYRAIYQCSVYIVVPHDSAAKTKLLTPLLNYEVFKVHRNVNTHM